MIPRKYNVGQEVLYRNHRGVVKWFCTAYCGAQAWLYGVEFEDGQIYPVAESNLVLVGESAPVPTASQPQTEGVSPVEPKQTSSFGTVAHFVAAYCIGGLFAVIGAAFTGVFLLTSLDVLPKEDVFGVFDFCIAQTNNFLYGTVAATIIAAAGRATPLVMAGMRMRAESRDQQWLNRVLNAVDSRIAEKLGP
jgi:hypothetical protein